MEDIFSCRGRGDRRREEEIYKYKVQCYTILGSLCSIRFCHVYVTFSFLCTILGSVYGIWVCDQYNIRFCVQF